MLEPNPKESLPKFFYVQTLATCLLVFGAAETAFASQWEHEFGIGTGVITLTCGLALAAFVLLPSMHEKAGYTKGFLSDEGRTFVGRAHNALCLCGPVKAVCVAVSGLALFTLLLITIHIASADRSIHTFPTHCEKPKGCMRIAFHEPHTRGNDELVPLGFDTVAGHLLERVGDWIEREERGSVLSTHPSHDGTGVIIHMRFISLIWGFADDMVVKLSCGPIPETEASPPPPPPFTIFKTPQVKILSFVEVHSELRLGSGDMGVNVERAQRLWNFLAYNSFFPPAPYGTMHPGPHGECSACDPHSSREAYYRCIQNEKF